MEIKWIEPLYPDRKSVAARSRNKHVDIRMTQQAIVK